MSRCLLLVACLLSLSVYSQKSKYRDYYIATLGGKDIKVNTFRESGHVTKDRVRYHLNNDGTASAYRDGYPDIRDNAHIYIEDTVRYKNRKYVVTEIEENAWFRAHHVLSVRLPLNITSIPTNSFEGCYEISKIAIPPNVIDIEDRAFMQTGIDTLVVPESVKRIGYMAFYGCSGLKYIEIPASVETIGEYAFRECNEMRTFMIHAKKPPVITGKVFSSVMRATLTVPEGYVELYKNADGWRKFKIIKETGTKQL